jgi:hypothetical protein
MPVQPAIKLAARHREPKKYKEKLKPFSSRVTPVFMFQPQDSQCRLKPVHAVDDDDSLLACDLVRSWRNYDPMLLACRRFTFRLQQYTEVSAKADTVTLGRVRRLNETYHGTLDVAELSLIVYYFYLGPI